MPDSALQRLLAYDLDRQVADAPLTWDGIVLRCWGLLFSWLGGILFAIPVCWVYGFVLLKTHPNPLPLFYGAPTLAQLPDHVAWRAAIFVAGTGGCVFGGLYGVYFLIAEWQRVGAARVGVVLLALEALSVWIMVTRDNWAGALPCALVLPLAVFAGHRLAWWLRCKCA